MNLSGEVVDPFLIQVLRDKRRDYELTDIINGYNKNNSV